MILESNIDWTDYTWNIATGCTKVSEGCKFCYMMRDQERYHRPGGGTIVKQTTASTFNKPNKIKATRSQVHNGPPLVFTSSLTDFFHEDCDPFRPQAWEMIRKNKHLVHQILTKRIERANDHLPTFWEELSNVWLGVSVESSDYLKRVDHLLNIPGPQKRFISIEPLLGKIEKYKLEKYFFWPYFNPRDREMDNWVDWVIIGGESGNDTGKWQYRECKLEWIEDIVDLCKQHKVPVFVKQMGTHIAKAMGISRHGKKVKEFPKHLQIQEFPV